MRNPWNTAVACSSLLLEVVEVSRNSFAAGRCPFCRLFVAVGVVVGSVIGVCLWLLLLVLRLLLLLLDVFKERLISDEVCAILGASRRFGFVSVSFSLLRHGLDVHEHIGYPFFPLGVEILDAIWRVSVQPSAFEHIGDVLSDVQEGGV